MTKVFLRAMTAILWLSVWIKVTDNNKMLTYLWAPSVSASKPQQFQGGKLVPLSTDIQIKK
jgi:hypothetical protein